jgi:2-haloalkanoic acid dehalogenase type II
MALIKAVLFDFGGTLFDYAVLEDAERQCLAEFMRFLGLDVEARLVHRAYRTALGKVFSSYLPRKFYLHRDLFKDAVLEMLRILGTTPDPGAYDWYRDRQWELHKRDFQLRPGVLDTLTTIRAKGVHLGIVSNIDEDQLQHLLEISKIEAYFDSVLSSEKTRSCKPDSAIFNQALDAADCLSREALFVGDTPVQDIAGANQAGMKSVLIRPGDADDPLPEPQRPKYIIREIPELLELL